MALILKNSVGLTGEYAVLSQLILHGHDVGLTLGHTKNIDILVSDPETRRKYEVEVKTNLQTSPKSGESNSTLFGKIISHWQMHSKHERISSPHLFYCFVHINTRDFKFRYFIVPSTIVANYVRRQHLLWLRQDSNNKDSDRRVFRIGAPNARKIRLPAPLASKWENNWHFARNLHSRKICSVCR